MFGFAEIFRDRPVQGFMNAQGLGAPGGHRRSTPIARYASGPNTGSSQMKPIQRVAARESRLWEKGMNGSEQGRQKIEARSQMRPESGDMLKPIHAFLLAKSRSDASVVCKNTTTAAGAIASVRRFVQL